MTRIALAVLLLAWFGATSSTAQSQNQKRVTSVHLGTANEGSRVTVVSESALSDYEAYRRGDRFYVKIPAAQFASAVPNLSGAGFEDVQVQKAADSSIITFRLRPGTAARVDQRSNGLDVVFSTLGRSENASGTTANGTGPAQSASESRADTSGPVPSQSSSSRDGLDSSSSTPTGVGRPTSRSHFVTQQSAVGSQPVSSETASKADTAASSPGASGTATDSPDSLLAQVSTGQPTTVEQQPKATTPETTSSRNLPVSLGQWLAQNWLLAAIVPLLVVSLPLLFVGYLRRNNRPERSESLAKPKNLGDGDPNEPEPAALGLAAPDIAETQTTREAESRVEPFPLVPPSSETSKTQKTVETQPTKSVLHSLEATPLIAEQPLSNTAVPHERIDFEVRKLLAGEHYDASVINPSDLATRQFIAARLVAALGDRSLEQHEPARQAFLNHGYFDESTRDLRTADSPAERASAASTLGKVGSPLGTAHLIAALDDSAPEVRRSAVESLGQIGDPSAIKPLNDLLLRETSRELPEAVIRHAIQSIAVPAVWPVEKAPSPDAESPYDRPVFMAYERESHQESSLSRTPPETNATGTVNPEMPEPPLAAPITSTVMEDGFAVEEARLRLQEEALKRAAEELECRRLEAEAVRKKVEEEARLKAANEERAREEAETRLKAEEAARRAEEEAARQRAEEEAARYRAEEEARLEAEREILARSEAEAKHRAEEDARFRLEAETLRRAAEELSRRRAEAETARLAEEEARRRAEEEMRQRLAEEARLRTEEEAQRKVQEELRRQAEEELRLREEEEARRLADQEARRREEEERLQAEAEERRRVAEERLKQEQEALMQAAVELTRRRAEVEQARRRAEEESRLLEQTQEQMLMEEERRRLVEEERLRLEAESQRRAEEERKRVEEFARLQAEEEERRLAELDLVRKQAEQRALQRAEQEQRIRAEIEMLRQAELEQHKRIEAETRRRAEAEARLKDEESRRQAEEAARLRVEEEARRMAEEARMRAEEERWQRAEAEERLRAEESLRQEQEVQLRAQKEALRLADENRLVSEEEEARRRAEEQVRLQAEQEARLRAEEESRRQAEEQARLQEEEARLQAEEESRRQAEEEARLEAERRSARIAEETRLRAEQQDQQAPWFDVRVDHQEGEVASHAEESIAMSAAAGETVASGQVQEPVKGIADAQFDKTPARIANDSSIPPDVFKRLNSNESRERAAALAELAPMGGNDVFSYVSRAFDDDSADVRNAAAHALYEMQLDRAASFTRALREGTPERRRRIGAALAASGLANNAISNLTGESREKTYDAFSLLFLMAKAGEVQPLMQAIEEHANIEVRLAVVKLLALSGQVEIVPAFRRLAVRGSLPSEVRSAVMEAIYQINSQSRESAHSAA